MKRRQGDPSTTSYLKNVAAFGDLEEANERRNFKRLLHVIAAWDIRKWPVLGVTPCDGDSGHLHLLRWWIDYSANHAFPKVTGASSRQKGGQDEQHPRGSKGRQVRHIRRQRDPKALAHIDEWIDQYKHLQPRNR